MFQRILNSFQSKHVLLKEVKNAAVVTINRPERMNTYTVEMPKQIFDLLKDLEKSEKSHVIIEGAGDRAFCAGVDLQSAIKCSDETFAVAYHGSNMMDLISNYKKPFIAMVDGIFMGSACFFSMTAKYRIATERTVFAMPEARIGFFPDGGTSYYLPRMKHNLGYYIGLACARLHGYDVKKFGIATHYIESKEIEKFMNSLGNCENETEVDETINKYSAVPTSQNSELDEIISKVDKCFGGSSVEEIYDNLHHDGSKWAQQTIKTLDQMSPKCLKVCHKLLTMGKELTLKECLQLEYDITHNILYHDYHDFKEGIRALIIDKDLKPNWNPKTLAEVKDAVIHKIFTPLPDNLKLKFEIEESKSKL